MNIAEQGTDTNLERRDVFDKLYALINVHDEDYLKDFALGNFYDYVSSLERKLQDINELDYDNKQSLNELIDISLTKFIIVFEETGFKDIPLFYAFKRFLKLLTYIVENSYNVKEFKKLWQYFEKQFPSLGLLQVFLYNNPSTFRYTTSVRNASEKIINEFSNSFPEEILRADYLRIVKNNHRFSDIAWKPRKNKPGESNKDNGSYVSINDGYYTSISMRVEDKLTSNLLKPVWALCLCLEKIKGNTVEIDRIKRGSIEIDVTVWSDGLISHEETKAYLTNTTQKLAKSFADDTTEESSAHLGGKAEEAIAKLKSAGHDTPQQVEDVNSSTPYPAKPNKKSRRSKDIDEKIKEAELQLKLLEVEKAKNEAARGRFELIRDLSAFTTVHMLEPDQVHVEINQVYEILKIGSNIQVNGNIDETFDC